MTYDLILKGGTVVDPSQGLHAVRDVALSKGVVAAVEPDIVDGSAQELFDARGLIVTPGLIDLHVHVFWGASQYGINPDPVHIACGVTTVLDAGSSGARTFPAFRRYVIERSKTRVFALLNISSMGMVTGYGGLEDPRWANVDEAVAVGHKNRDAILGIKARIPPQDEMSYVEIVRRGLKAAEMLGGFFMLHTGGPSVPFERLVDMLRPGDVATHSFRGGSFILDNSGRVHDRVREAQRRGVVFDIGHGGGSFAVDTARKALDQDFKPSTISSDLHIGNVEGPVFDLVTTLSKFLHLGLSLDEVIERSTHVPAKILGVPDELGTLKVGARGDITLLRLDEGRFKLTDAPRESVEARQRLSHVVTFRAGRRYRQWME